jgi:hypothetical protein
MDPIRFLTGEPALQIGKSLVVADLHLGIEREFYQSGIKFPSQTEKIAKRMDGLIKETKAERLVILGDVKHKVPGISIQEMREVPEFLNHLSEKAKVDIVAGNHDGGLEKFAPPQVRIHPGSGFALDGIYFSHGHAWPGGEFLSCSHIIIGHQHPFIEFRDRLGYRFREPVWVRGALDRDRLKERYKEIPGKLPELVIMPAFNELSGGAAINLRMDAESVRNFIGPVMKAADEKKLRIYLLDGTYLGSLPDLKKKL